MAKVTKNTLEMKVKDINSNTNLDLEIKLKNIDNKNMYCIYTHGKEIHRGLAFDTNEFLEGIYCGIQLQLTGRYEKWVQDANVPMMRDKNFLNNSIEDLLLKSKTFKISVRRTTFDSRYTGDVYNYIFSIRDFSNSKILTAFCFLEKVLADGGRPIRANELGTIKIDITKSRDKESFALQLLKMVDDDIYNRAVVEKSQGGVRAIRKGLEYLLWVTSDRQKMLTETIFEGINTKGIIFIGMETVEFRD